MNLMLADSHAFQVEAFHLPDTLFDCGMKRCAMATLGHQIQNAIRFKIFVVNPQKPLRIQQILVKNKDAGRGKLVQHDQTK